MKINKKLNISTQQFIVEVISVLLLLSFIVLFFIMYAQKGEYIFHYIDEYHFRNIPKTTILVLPIVCFVVYGLISFLQFYPKLWNISKEQDNKQNSNLLECMKLMIAYTKVLFIGIFFYIAMVSLAGKELNVWFLITAIILAVLEIAYFIARFYILNKKYSAKKDLNENETSVK
jgi:hypothetical protein